MSLRDRSRRSGAHEARGPRRRLFVKYLIVLVGLVGGAVLVTSLVALYFTYRDTEAAAARLVERTAFQEAGAVAEAGLRATLEVSQAIPGAPADAPPTLAERRASYARRLGAVRRFTYVDREGRERLRVGAAGPRAGTGRDISREPAVRSVLAGEEWGPHQAFGEVSFPDGRPGGLLVPQLLVAVGEQGGPGGATVGLVGTDSVIPVEFYDWTSDVTLYLVDSRGRLLARPPDADARASADPFAAGVAGFPDLTRLPQVAAAVRGASPEGVPLVFDSPLPRARPASWQRNADGDEVLSSSAPVEMLGWQVIAEQRRSDVLAPVYSAAVRTGIFLVVSLGLAVLASALLARRMVSPIALIDSGARRIGEGALDERIEVTSGDELQSLAETFNRMAGQLGDLYADLERRVETRTRDLTVALEENAALLRRLEQKGSDLEAASRHKSEFLATMSHELRTPLNAIIGFSEVLQERMFGELNERQAEYLEDIRASGRHLLALIDDILDLAKVEAGRMELDVGEVDVGECLEMGATMVRERATRQGVRLEIDVDPALGRIPADGRRLRQVVFNLLSNAVKFTPEGGTVTASARAGEGEVVIAVRDTGPGIAPRDRQRIFETFQQAGDRAGLEGSGLGLPLSRALVELHGGRLWLESRIGEGSTFSLALPLVAAGVRR